MMPPNLEELQRWVGFSQFFFLISNFISDAASITYMLMGKQISLK